MAVASGESKRQTWAALEKQIAAAPETSVGDVVAWLSGALDELDASGVLALFGSSTAADEND